MHVYVTALKLYNGTDHSNLDVLDIARSFTSLETYMDLYIYMYIDSGLELEKKKRGSIMRHVMRKLWKAARCIAISYMYFIILQ